METKKDGSITETVKTADGVTGTVSTDKDGNITGVSASVSYAAAKDAAGTGRTVTLPVEIPVETVTPGTVAVILHAGGPGGIVTTSLPARDGVALTLDGSATVKIVDNSRDFSDTVDHWAEDYIDFATARELFAGTSDTTFTPNRPMTRAMIVTVLWRMKGSPAVNYLMDFSDVDPAAYYGEAVRCAASEGIVGGSGDPITREQFAVMLWRYAGSPAVSSMALNEFGDSAGVSTYAVDAMRWAVSVGIIGGSDAGLLMPRGTATRAQVVAMLTRFVEDLSQ